MEFIKISSKDNSLIKKVVKLALDAKMRKDEQLALINGEHLVEEAIKYEVLHSLFINEESQEQYNKLIEISKLKVVYILPHEIMNKINFLENASNISALIKIKYLDLIEDVYNEDCVILENIQDPGNLGTIMRSCAASGVKNIVLSTNCVDIYNPKVLRSSQGIQLGLNMYANIDLISFVGKYNRNLLITSSYADKSLYDAELIEPVAFVFGNEGIGVSSELTDVVLNHIKIPIANSAESINVAMATTVCLFEMLRQRIYRE